MARASTGGQPFDSEAEQVTIRNPATGETVDTVPAGTRVDAQRAIDRAQAAFESWADLAASKRAETLYRGAESVLEHKDELSRLLTCEQGKPLREAGLEIQRFAHTLHHYAGLGKGIRGGHVPLGEGRYGMIIKRPIGVCGAIAPWNFPVSLMGNKIAPALLVGNTVVRQARQHDSADRHSVHRAFATDRVTPWSPQCCPGSGQCGWTGDSGELQGSQDRFYRGHRDGTTSHGNGSSGDQASDSGAGW